MLLYKNYLEGFLIAVLLLLCIQGYLSEHACPQDRSISSATPLITDELPTESFTETDYDKLRSTSSDASKLVFSKEGAWCLLPTAAVTDKYKDSATVDLTKQHRISSFQVNGFVEVLGEKTNTSLAENFKLEFSLDNTTWSPVEGGMAFKSESYVCQKFILKSPLRTRYVRIYMSQTEGKTSCMKLQLYEEKATDTTITTPIVVPTSSNTTIKDECPDCSNTALYIFIAIFVVESIVLGILLYRCYKTREIYSGLSHGKEELPLSE